MRAAALRALAPFSCGGGMPLCVGFSERKGKRTDGPINRLCDFHVVRAVRRERGAVVPETICSERERDEEKKKERISGPNT